MADKDPERSHAADGDAWHDARQAVVELRDVLIAAGMETEFKTLTTDVDAFGRGIVSLGKVMVGMAAWFADALALGPCVEIAELPCVDQSAPERSARFWLESWASASGKPAGPERRTPPRPPSRWGPSAREGWLFYRVK
ncbi:hypothetical protein [Yinghuangia sp. YIM S09857]|uniref:hypothetical protein n=1 Tax=Yinghuangia sp. YIM S09857 TaxID=3436929 RepID=UPI003F52D826